MHLFNCELPNTDRLFQTFFQGLYYTFPKLDIEFLGRLLLCPGTAIDYTHYSLGLYWIINWIYIKPYNRTIYNTTN